MRACQDDSDIRHHVEELLRPNRPSLDGDAGNVPDIDETTHTALAPGARLGSFQIEEPIGSGGMGAVFKAKDTRLDRTVAIKILKREFSARFHREARAIAALNHPNICTLHEAGPNYLVMEFIEGETLAGVVKRGPIPVGEAVKIARQIGAALQAAHERGIVHRDLKPANIRITQNGAVKVLDFGLAKMAVDPQPGPEAATAELSLTEVGTVIGTPSYMAPEQATGKPADKRADVWAFGAVLYEMLTGRKPFSGETTAEVLAAVLGREPDWEPLRRRAAPSLVRLIERCLRKDPNHRLRDIGDAQLDLDDALTERAQPIVKIRRREYLAWCIAGALAIAWIAALVWRGEAPSSGALHHSRLDCAPAGPEIGNGGHGGAYCFVHRRPAARLCRGTGRPHATLRPGTGGPRRQTDFGHARRRASIFFPDGRWIAFFAAGALQKVAVAGGAPIRICTVRKKSVGGAWGASNQIVFALRQSGLFRVDARQAANRSLWLDPPLACGRKSSPTKERFSLRLVGRAIAAIPLEGGQRRIVAHVTDPDFPGPAVLGSGAIVQARYLPGGYLIYGQSRGMLRAIAFDLKSLAVAGSPVPILDSLEQGANGGGIYFAVSATGSLVYATSGDRHQLVWVDRDGDSDQF